MPAIPTALGLLTSQDGTLHTLASPISTDPATLTKDAGALHTPWMIPRTPGELSDLRVVHLVLPVGGWTIGIICHMKSLLVVLPVLPVSHLRGILVLPLRAELLPRLHPPFAPPESGQNLRRGLANILDRLCSLLLTLVPTLRNLLCDHRFSEVTL